MWISWYVLLCLEVKERRRGVVADEGRQGLKGSRRANNGLQIFLNYALFMQEYVSLLHPLLVTMSFLLRTAPSLRNTECLAEDHIAK